MKSSRLSGTTFSAAREVVEWHGGMQAQDYGPAKWSVGQRATNLTDEDLDLALASGSILRTHVLRPTWHFVSRNDIRRLLAITGPRVQQHNESRYLQLGLDNQTRARCETLIAAALGGGIHLTRREIGDILEDAGIDTSGQRLPHILMHSELEAVVCSGVPQGRQQTYALLDERAPDNGRFHREEALVDLVRRYFSSHGPATVQDLRWWSSLTVADIKSALLSLASELRRDTIDGLQFWCKAPDEEVALEGNGAHFLQAYDELIVGYRESRYFGDPRRAAARAAWKNRELPNGLVLLDGAVAGHWRRKTERDRTRVELLMYDYPTGSADRALEDAARDLARFLRRAVKTEVRRL
jgi:hypothetical protein